MPLYMSIKTIGKSSYALLPIPGETEWTIILSPDLSQ
jgi:hypothetical protein